MTQTQKVNTGQTSPSLLGVQWPANIQHYNSFYAAHSGQVYWQYAASLFHMKATELAFSLVQWCKAPLNCLLLLSGEKQVGCVKDPR